jgi:hypothetical protein
MIASMSAQGRQRAGTEYEIVVRGRAGEALAAELGARRLEPRRARTLIVVEIIDQSHLHGVLERLRDLNIDIVSVNPAPPSRGRRRR